MLNEKGVILITTPDRRYRLNDGQKPWNKFHLREYTREQFEAEIKKVFPSAAIYQMTGNKDIISVEYTRVAASRLDKKVYRGIEAGREALSKEYSLDDFWLSEYAVEESVCLFAIVDLRN